ncbi:MAG TPA: metal ABC transporter substrate-binding protein [Candidatus Limnocylindrales bacterium]|jgi:zinc/manganese transport system substrate-binding protein/manganese/iron transport system substrate-binding protein
MRLSRSRRRPTVLLGIAAAAIVLTACVPARAAIGPSADPDALRVTATTTVLADIVKSVGGARTSVQSIVPPGVGPEDYEPRPADARSIADAQLIVSNGVGLDTFLDRLIRSAGGDSAPRLVLGDGLPAIEVDGEPNPHFWLDPTIVRDGYLPKIVDALSEAAPKDRPTFEANAAAFAKQLTALDSELAAQVATIPPANRKLVTFHDAFPYFARHFGFDLVGVVLANVGQEPTPADLAALVQKVKAAGVKAVFSEAQFNPKLAQTLAQEAGVQQVVTTLYNDALGPAPADTYPGMMRWNMQQIVDALR